MLWSSNDVTQQGSRPKTKLGATKAMLTDEESKFGYWGARRLAGKLPSNYYAEPSDYKGEDALCLFKAPPLTLSPAQERKRIARWCEALPHMKIKMLMFEFKVNQALFEAATKVQGLEALWAPHSTCTSIASLAHCPSLRALEFGSSSLVSDLQPLSTLSKLKSLRLIHMRETSNLDFAGKLKSLREFGFLWSSIDRVPAIESLVPLASLHKLQLLWLDVMVATGSLSPLHQLKNLVTLNVSYDYSASEFGAIRAALPSLKYGAPFNEYAIRESCSA